MLVVLLCWRKKTTWSSAVKEIYTRTTQNHRHWFDPLYLRLMALLWESLEKKKKESYMKFILLRGKNLTEKTDHATLQCTHEVFGCFFSLKQTIYRTPQKWDLACNTVCSLTEALQFHLCSILTKKNPTKKHLIFSWIGLIMAFLPSILSFFLKRRSRVKRKQVLCWWNCHVSPGHHGPLPAMQLDTHPWHISCHQNAVCHLVLGMHMCGEQRGLNCAAGWNHTTTPCPSSAIPSGKGGNDRHCTLATRDS